MRIMIKGGVWKNTEDEILKAAVMKYGKNQWSRISSLLTRKSAKQCKARWYEWLDPSIKKTEWNRDEEEKLLHLAKLMPCQWRTIAPIIGRTAAQCLEHYEKLLDAAQEKDEDYDPSEDPRRLRPGEIDPNPETKPARPDPVDMDEDEKEMLSEARARLANTRGKKAKRKAREQQLEEARRLASLQKRRELRAAGIDIRTRKRRAGFMDYNAEIPFEKKAAIGFFDPSADDKYKADPKFVKRSLQQMEGERRIDKEMEERKKDAKRQKKQKAENLPGALSNIDKLNDPESIHRRSKLSLPSPQITDDELAEVAKLSQPQNRGAVDDGESATSTLLADYATPAATPVGRTPMRTPSRESDVVLTEAQNLIALTTQNTPLLGDTNVVLNPTDFRGVTPSRAVLATPNAIVTPGASVRGGATPGGATGASVRGSTRGGATPGATPLRDDLGINSELTDEQVEAKLLRAQVASGLSTLPTPKHEYSIQLPEGDMPEDDEGSEGDGIVEDAADRKKRLASEKQAVEDAAFKLLSQPLQRGLPRPTPEAVSAYVGGLSIPKKPTSLQSAAAMVEAEISAIVAYEAVTHPTKGKAKKKKLKELGPRDEFSRDQLESAKLLILEESLDDKQHNADAVDPAVFTEAWEAAAAGVAFLPGSGAHGLSSSATKAELVSALRNQFEGLRAQMDEDAKKAAKVLAKAELLTKGLETRGKSLLEGIRELYYTIDTATSNFASFEAVHAREQPALPWRVSTLEAEVAKQVDREAELQARYRELLQEHAAVSAGNATTTAVYGQ